MILPPQGEKAWPMNRMTYFLQAAGLTLMLALFSAVAVGCSHGRDDAKNVHRIGEDNQLTVKQGGGVPPQPARLDRPDPPLVEAARAGDARRVRALLDGGADANAFGAGRTTALMAAAERADEEVARLLIERNADANLRNAKGQTAAELADANGHGRLRGLLERKEVKPPPGPANPVPAK